jgi:hypothetical protein
LEESACADRGAEGHACGGARGGSGGSRARGARKNPVLPPVAK